MKLLTRPLLALPLALTIAATPTQRVGIDERPITETDLYRFNWIADPQISPDGSQIVYVRVSVNDKRDAYQSSLWLAPTRARIAPRQFTGGPRDLAPAWSPDGRMVAFLRVMEKDGKPQPAQIYLMSMDGGEARQLTEMKKGAGAPVWSPDGRTIAFSTSTPAEIMEEQRQRDEPERPVGDTLPSRPDTAARGAADSAEEKSDVRVITRAVYRMNGPGYLDPSSHDHIWTVAIPAPGEKAVAKQITFGEFDENRPTWSPDGSRIYFTSTRTPEPYYLPPDADLYSVPATGGEITKVASIDGVIGSFSFSPDGRSIAFVGTLEVSPPRSHDQSDLFVVENAPGKTARNLTTAYDFDIDGGIASDQHAPRGRLPSPPVWSADGSSIIVRAAEHGRANLKRVAVSSGRVAPFSEGDQEVVAYTATRDAARFALVVSTPTVIGDLYVTAPASGGRPAALAAVVKPNESLWAELTMTEPEEIWYRSFDGQRIHGWIQKPPGFDPSKKYPMILQIHGGPHAAYGYTFYHEIQWMAAKGYVVLYTNPRGSSSYGQEFGNIIQYRYPGDDYKDLMIGVDTLVARGYVDARRLGVTGGSGGGILTNWTITQTDRFAAAVAQRSIADWGNFWFTADFSQFTPFWFRKAPWQDPREFAERSPINYVDRIVTPLMLVEGEADWRTPPGAGGELMFRALKFLKKPVVMVRFPDESHDLSRSGKPRHRIERLQHIVNWFDKYLLGREVAGYAGQ
jgi:dipeptidyl aminopeptidase/acylaminoacyl peptidase